MKPIEWICATVALVVVGGLLAGAVAGFLRKRRVDRLVASAPQRSGPSWSEPTFYMNEAVVRAFFDELVARRPELEPLPSFEDADAIISWAREYGSGQVWADGGGGIEVFFASCRARHGAELTAHDLREDYPDEVFERWEHVGTDEAYAEPAFWFRDASRPERLRLVVLGFDYDHQHIRHEYPTASAFVCLHVLPHLLDEPFGDQPWPNPDELGPLRAPSRALLDCLPLFDGPVPADHACDVAGILRPDRQLAIVELTARRVVEYRILQDVDGIVAWRIDALRATERLAQFDASPTAQMRERYAERTFDPEQMRRVRQMKFWP